MLVLALLTPQLLSTLQDLVVTMADAVVCRELLANPFSLQMDGTCV